ncbi:MAG: radical SAM protein [Desulfobacter sp.]
MTRRVALLSVNPWHGAKDFQLNSAGVYRLQAALITDPEAKEVECRVFDGRSWNILEYIDMVEEFHADIVGLSVATWSVGLFVELAARIRRNRHKRLIIMGGPCARPSVLSLPPYTTAVRDVDALVTGEGENVLREIVRATIKGNLQLEKISGLLVSDGKTFAPTRHAPPIADLDSLASPYALGITPGGTTAYLETFRGCPMSCGYCQDGGSKTAMRKFSTEYLTRELQAIQASGASGVYCLDPALNLNKTAFRRLACAEAETGFLRNSYLICEIYPSLLDSLHLDFFSKVKTVIGIGVQSLNAEVLQGMGRPFNYKNFLKIVEQLHGIAQVTVEIILGLPGDNPASFRRTLEELLELPCNLRIFSCLALPGALMDVGADKFRVSFDPLSFEVTNCLGWSQEALAKEKQHLDKLTIRRGGWRSPGRLKTGQGVAGEHLAHDVVLGWAFPGGPYPLIKF